MAKLELLVTSITKSRNPKVFMCNTSKGGFPVRKSLLDKRGINVGDTAYKFAEPTVGIFETYLKGDRIFGVEGALEDSETMHGEFMEDGVTPNPKKGTPVYLKGEHPVWSKDGANTKSFVTVAEWKAEREMQMDMLKEEILKKQLSKASA